MQIAEGENVTQHQTSLATETRTNTLQRYGASRQRLAEMQERIRSLEGMLQQRMSDEPAEDAGSHLHVMTSQETEDSQLGDTTHALPNANSPAIPPGDMIEVEPPQPHGAAQPSRVEPEW